MNTLCLSNPEMRETLSYPIPEIAQTRLSIAVSHLSYAREPHLSTSGPTRNPECPRSRPAVVAAWWAYVIATVPVWRMLVVAAMLASSHPLALDTCSATTSLEALTHLSSDPRHNGCNFFLLFITCSFSQHQTRVCEIGRLSSSRHCFFFPPSPSSSQ